MSLSSAIDRRTGRLNSGMIPPEIAKGELVTGGRIIEPERRRFLESVQSLDNDKIVVPAGENGSVLQADSSTNTGLRWVSHEPVAMSLRKTVNSIVEFLKPLVQERIEAQRLKLNTESIPKIFIRDRGLIYTVPLNSQELVQNLIDYLNQMYLVTLMNNSDVIELTFQGKMLVNEISLADYNIENESTLYILHKHHEASHGGGCVKMSKKNTTKKIKKNKNKKRK
jgi:uncharacterized ubiquitin-like protein YukD